ncbi:hypothetical protein V6C53_12055 [Desulfocurvibacter africanus]
MNMEYSRENHLKSPNAPRRRVYHPRNPKFAVILVILAVIVWFLFRDCG